jgi:DNA polymerase-3 subunit delta'
VVTAFDDVIGHRAVLDLLASDASRPAQAYLFVGRAGVGKATVARRFASLLLCPDADPSCLRRVLTGRHPDLIAVEPDGRTSLTVDRARATVAQAVLAPVEADRKVFLFEEAGMMNDEAANALLKTLEEPTSTTVFILVAEAEDDLPPTVASRSRTVFFGRVAHEDVVVGLMAADVPEEQARHAAGTSGGRPGLALMLATRPEVAAFRQAWLQIPTRLDPQPGTAFRLAEELTAASDPLLEALEDRQQGELDSSQGDAASTRVLKERHERERKRAVSALHVTGLEILASWYRDAAAAQFGAPVRNPDVSGTDLTRVTARAAVAKAERVLSTIESLEANQRADLALAALFADLATPT